MSNEWDWWSNAVEGNFGPLTETPETGFYRIKSNDKSTWEPVAIWRQPDGELRCQINGKEVDADRAHEKWTWFCKNPITHELYNSVLEDKQPWPDLHEAVTRSNQAPPDNSFEALTDRIEDLVREAAKIDGPVQTQDEADRAADLANKIGELQAAADEQRVAEKKPHDEASKAVQTKWKPVVDIADSAKRRLKSFIVPFLAAKEAAERRAREEAAIMGAPVPEPEQRGSTTKAGTRGRAVSLRTIKQVQIVDRTAVLAYFTDGNAMSEFLQNMAEKAVRAGVDVPGTKVTEQKIAA